MLRITNENALSYAHIWLVLAIIWLMIRRDILPMNMSRKEITTDNLLRIW